MRRLACAAALLLPAAGGAQALAWQVPHRGAHVYARTTAQFDVDPPPSRLKPEWRVLDGQGQTPHVWRYATAAHGMLPPGWEQPGFDDTAWASGNGEFGPEVGRHGQRTAWQTAQIALRTRVDLGPKRPRALWFVADHDDGLRIWLNGRLVVADDGFGRDRHYVVAGSALDAWTPGTNVLAVQCTNTGGWQHLDLALATFATLPPGTRDDDLPRLLREDREAAATVRRELFGAYRPPPLLLQGELDDRAQYVRSAPGDLRDLAWWLAMDLRPGVPGGPIQFEAPRLFRLGDIVLRGRATAIDADGWQSIEVAVRSTAVPAPRGDSNRYVDRFVRPHVRYGVDGTLVVRRHIGIDGGRARVDRFESRLDARLLRGKDWKEIAATVQQREAWQLEATRDNQDAAFRAGVQAALDRGTKALRDQLRDLGGADLAAQPEDAGDSYHGGRLAIGLLALVKGGVPKDDEVVVRGYDELRRRRLVDTYSLANAIMAVEALYAPASEHGDLRQGSIDRPRKRQPAPADLALLQRWTTQLLANVDTRVDPSYVLRFNYTRGERFDNSVNQYGLLGLYSAHLCGVGIPPTVWEAAMNHLLAAQSPEGPKVDLDLVDYRTLARRQADPEAPFTVSRSIARANGWSYHEPKSDGELAPTWGSMTCAGITGLAIAEAGLLDHPNVKRPRLLGDARRARDCGFAWLAQWFNVRHHPGAIERQQQWFYYYLYGLERAALLSGVALIQDRDWYFEGAMVLVLAQQPDGHWPPELQWDRGIERNAMAILFLKQSTSPVLTGR